MKAPAARILNVLNAESLVMMVSLVKSANRLSSRLYHRAYRLLKATA